MTSNYDPQPPESLSAQEKKIWLGPVWSNGRDVSMRAELIRRRADAIDIARDQDAARTEFLNYDFDFDNK